MVQVKCDFSKYEDYPLVNSKFGMYICTYVDADRTLRDMPYLKELEPFALRYDPGWGVGNDENLNSPREYNAPQIEKEQGGLKANFTDYDRMVDALKDTDIKMLFVNGYNPICLQDNSAELQGNMEIGMRSRWNTMPVSMEDWKDINRMYAAHFKEKFSGEKFYEIWNEPDLQPVFFTGTIEEYFEIYKNGARGVKEGDPEAKVGGPVIANAAAENPEVANAADWAEEFLNFVQKENLPLDFFSYHNYASPKDVVTQMRNVIRNRAGMENVDTVLSEYNSYHPGTRDFTVGGEIERHHLAVRLLEDFKFFVAQSDLTCVYWAQFNDPEVFGDYVDRCGLIALDGSRKAAYHAMKIYAGMPADRVCLESSDGHVDGMASFAEQKAAVVLWNHGKERETVEIFLDNLSFSEGEGRIYKIDAWRSSHIDNLTEDELKLCGEFSIQDGRCSILEEMLGESVCYLEIVAASQTTDSSCRHSRQVKVKHYYFDRYKTNYAEYDAQEGAVYLGMGGEKEAVSMIELSLKNGISGFAYELRDVREPLGGMVKLEVERRYADGKIERKEYVLTERNSEEPRVFFGDENVTETCIKCRMEHMNPEAKAKIRLL